MRLPASKWLGGIKPVRNKMVTATVIVLAIAFTLLPLGRTIIDVHDGLLKSDRLTALSQIISGVPANAVPVTMLDVDDATRQAWRADTVTPHQALAELIRIAAQGGARAIMLDFDLSADGPGQAGDPALAQLLEGYQPDLPLLMLVRTIGFVRSDSGGGESELQAVKAPASFYDTEAKDKRNIAWVTTLNDIGSDRSVRRIRLWQSVCVGKSGTAYPSAALVTSALLTATPPRGKDLEAFLAQRVNAECGAVAPAERLAWPEFQKQAAVIPYVFNDNPDATALLRAEVGGKDTIILRRISAGRLVKLDGDQYRAAPDIDSDPFAGRVVIIGASYTGSRDVHETPLGTMPGSLILANSIVQADALTGKIPAGGMVHGLVVIALILIFAACARYLAGIVAVIMISALALASLIVLSRIFGVESGLDVAVSALTGFALFKLIDGLAQIAVNLPKSGWRAFLKF